MSVPNVLFVAWQDAESRRIVPIARLLRVGGEYEFAYVGAVEQARALGFGPLLAFPDISEVYRSKALPPLLSNRLMPKSRPEFPDYVGQLDLSEETAEPFTVLARSGGRRTTDRLEVFAPLASLGDESEGLFLVRGIRHVPGAEAALEQLAPGAPLRIMADVHNEVNPAALLLRCEEKRLVGFVPDYLANELASAGAQLRSLSLSVVKVNPPPAPVHHRLLCRLRCGNALGDRLFRGEAYRPLSARATVLAA